MKNTRINVDQLCDDMHDVYHYYMSHVHETHDVIARFSKLPQNYQDLATSWGWTTEKFDTLDEMNRLADLAAFVVAAEMGYSNI